MGGIKIDYLHDVIASLCAILYNYNLLGARHLWEVVENKPASSLVVSLGKALNGTPPPLCGRQVTRK